MFNFIMNNMEKSDIKINVKFVDVLNATYINAWEDMCEKYGINEWCLNEGLADDEDTISVSLEDAEFWGLIK